METEVHLALSEIRQQLKKKKYKSTLAKIQRIKSRVQINCYQPLSLFELLRLQISAVNKLLERNLLKKYKYPYSTVECLIDILTRNIEEMHEILCQRLEERGQMAPERVVPQGIVTFPLVKELEGQNKIKLEKLEPFYRNKGVSTTRKYIEKFIKIVNVSLVNQVQMNLLYRKQTSIKTLEIWANIPGTAFLTIPSKLSYARLHLLLGKMLSTSHVNQLERALKVLEHSTEELIDCLHMSNSSLYRTRENQNSEKHLKYLSLQKQCTKLLIISIVMTNKNNMKLNKEETSSMGCQIIKNTVNKLGHGFGYFKRLLQPEIYLLEQYHKYREEKKQMAGIVAMYFEDLKHKVQCSKQEQEMIFNRGVASKEIIARGCRLSDQRGVFDQIGTVKTMTTISKRKQNNSSIMTATKSTNAEKKSTRFGDSILTKMIIGHIEQLNTTYTGFKKQIGAGSYYKKMRTSHNKSLVHTPQQTLRKQKITPSNAMVTHEELTQRTQRIRQEEVISRRQAKEAKEKLMNRQKFNLIQNTLEDENIQSPVVCQIEKQIQNGKQFVNIRCSESSEFDQDEPEIKRRFHNMTKKTKIFVEILHMNRDFLGIKKIVEKVDLLKKKQEQKQKMMSNRITSLATRDKNQQFKNMHQFKLIASEIMKKHLNKNLDSGLDQIQKKKLIQANYTLGEDSIKTIRTKLAEKIDRKQKKYDRSDRNQDAFKQKLKRLGSTNFFMKRVSNTKAEHQQRQRSNSKNKRISYISYRRTSKAQFVDLSLQQS